MTVFVIIGTNPTAPLLKASLEKNYPGEHKEIAPDQFLVAAANVTSEDVATKLGANGEVGNMIVFTTAGYFGYHKKDIWEWIAAKST